MKPKLIPYISLMKHSSSKKKSVKVVALTNQKLRQFIPISKKCIF